MIDEDLLTDLADVPVPSPVRPLARIESRARQIRRWRRVRTAAAASMAACGIAVAATASPVWDWHAVQPGSGADSCDSSHDALVVTPESIAHLLYLPSEAVSGPVKGPALARHERSTCARTMTAGLWYTVRDGKVNRRFRVQGPNDPDAYRTSGGSFTGTTEDVDVAGADGRLYRNTDGPEWSRLFWTTADGGQWGVEAWGMSRDAVLAAARSLRIDGDRLDTSVRPVGLDRSWPLPPPRPTRDKRWFLAAFDAPDGDRSWSIEVSDLPPTNDVPFGGTMIDVNGTRGWWSTEEERGTTLMWRAADGVYVTINGGALTVEKALAAARSVTKVSPNDPRLVDAREDR